MDQIKLDGKRVKVHCTNSIIDYVELENFEYHATPDGQFYLFQDNGANVLAVAHLDTVLPDAADCQRHRDRVWSVALDDRLGAYIILEVLPALGIECDILLTIGEETSQSTAEHFNPHKAYNWVVEFDRAGTDVVTYQYQTAAWHEALTMAGFKIGKGCYSDIAELYTLGIACVNIGCGHKDSHTRGCRVNLRDTSRMVALFVDFYWRNYTTRFECDAPPPMILSHQLNFWRDVPVDRRLSKWETDILDMTFDEWRVSYDLGITRAQWIDLYTEIELAQMYDYCDGCGNLECMADMYLDPYHDLMYCDICDAAMIVDKS